MCHSLASETQWSIFMNYMKENKEFAAEIVNNVGPLEKRGLYHHWVDLAERLNCVTGSTKTPMQWRQYWNDKKYAVRGRIRRQQGNEASDLSALPVRAIPPAAKPPPVTLPAASPALETSPAPAPSAGPEVTAVPAVSLAPVAPSTSAPSTGPVDLPAAPASPNPRVATTSPATTQINADVGRASSSSPIVRRYRRHLPASRRDLYQLKQRRLVVEERRLALEEQLVSTLERGLDVQMRIASAQEKMLAIQQRIEEFLIYHPDDLFRQAQ